MFHFTLGEYFRLSYEDILIMFRSRFFVQLHGPLCVY